MVVRDSSEHRITLPGDQQYTDPRTGATTNVIDLSSPATHERLEFGYSTSGDPIGVDRAVADVTMIGSDAEAERVRITGWQLAELNAEGNQLAPDAFDGSVNPPSPLPDLRSIPDLVDLFDQSVYGSLLSRTNLSAVQSLRGTSNTDALPALPEGATLSVVSPNVVALNLRSEHVDRGNREVSMTTVSYRLAGERWQFGGAYHLDSTVHMSGGAEVSRTWISVERFSASRNALKDAARRLLPPATVGYLPAPVAGNRLGGPVAAPTCEAMHGRFSRLCGPPETEAPIDPYEQAGFTMGDNSLTGPCGHIRSKETGEFNLYFAHGLNSDACTWEDNVGRTAQRMVLAFPVKAFGAGDSRMLRRYQEQADNVADFTARLGNKPLIMIGHSNGGIVSRTLARRQGSGSLISGVITIQSPQLGAGPSLLRLARGLRLRDLWNGPLPAGVISTLNPRLGYHALRDSPAINSRFSMVAVGNNDWGQVLGPLIGGFGQSVAQRLSFLPDERVFGLDGDVLDQMDPSSTFLRDLNATPDPVRVVSLYSHPPERHLIYRLIGESTGSIENGDAWVRRMDRLSSRSKRIGSLARILGAAAVLVPGIGPQLRDAMGNVADKIESIPGAIANADLTWRVWVNNGVPTDGTGQSDGVVTTKSQKYVHAAPQDLYRIDGPAPTHVGAMKTGSTAEQLRRALRERFGQQCLNDYTRRREPGCF